MLKEKYRNSHVNYEQAKLFSSLKNKTSSN